MDEVPLVSQIKKDAHELYCALLSACQGGVGPRILMENGSKQDGIRSWYQIVEQYEIDDNRSARIKKLENVITTVFHWNYKVFWLSGFKTMKMHLQNLVYLDKRLGKTMISRNVGWFKMYEILAKLIQFLNS